MRANPLLLTLISIVTLSSAEADLESNQDYKNGVEAMRNQLPAVAAQRFEIALKDGELSEAEEVAVLFQLCEAQVRARRGVAAEKTLQNPLLKQHPKREFWLAQSLVAQGRLKEAVPLFEKVVATAEGPLESLSLLALLELYRSLNEPQKLSKVLQQAVQLPQLKVVASIEMAESYYQQQKFKQASEALQGVEPKLPAMKNALAYLKAKLNLAEGRSEQARRQFEALLKDAKLKSSYQDDCVMGIADSLADQGRYDEAISTLVARIDVAGDSASLSSMFERLLRWSGEVKDTKKLDEALEKWIARPEVLAAEDEEDGKEKEPIQLEFADRDAFAHFLLAKDLTRLAEPQKLQRALKLLSSLRQTHPMHSLIPRSWFLTSEVFLRLGQVEQAIQSLEQLQQVGLTAEVKQEAGMLIGLIHAEAGNSAASIEAFGKLVDQQSSPYSLQAQVNLALLQLKRGNFIAFADATGKISDEETRVGLMLEKGMDSLSKARLEARAELDAILAEAGQHPLVTPARLMLAKDRLAFQPVQPKLALQQIAALKELELRPEQQLALTELEMRALVFNGKWDKVIEKYLKQQSEAREISDSMIISLGEAYYRNGEFNKARKQFNKVIIERKGSPYAEYAYFFSALAAQKEGTPQSKQEALELLQKVIDFKGVFTVEAVLQKARLLIDLENLDKALALLKDALKQEQPAQSLAFLKTLLAEVYHRKALQDKNQEELFNVAAKLYNEVLLTKGMKDSWKHQVYFLLGQTQEKLDPSLSKALDSYFKVVNLEVQQQNDHPVEWEYYYKCGLRAVGLLEKQGRWGAAANLLDKMAGHFGPKSDVLRKRADTIRLQHHIW